MFPTGIVLRVMGQSAGVKPRPRHELVMRAVHPLVGPGVRALARLGVEPWQVVVAHGALGLAAAALVATSSPAAWAVAALLLQLKTLLDNLDGSLARATGRVTELGRYLDTGVDLIVNAALFAALAAHGPWPAALAAFLVLTGLLSYDFNAERLHREAHGEVAGQQLGAPPATAWERTALVLFRGLYRALLAPQDAAVRALELRLFRLASGRAAAEATEAETRAWWGVGSTATLVNLGLSTQYVALGGCLLLRAPFAYAWLVLAQGAYLGGVIAWRVLAYRRRVGPTAEAGSA